MTGPDGHTAREAERELERVRRAVAGDEAAFRGLYREHAGPLWRLALRMSGGREASAEDALQEAWRRAVGLMPSFEGRAPLRTWLSAIVVRCSLERIRRDVRDAGPPPEHALLSATRAPDAPIERLDLERAFESLPAGYRAVLVLHDVEGRTHAEIADLLGIEPGTSKSQLSRARAWMRRALGLDYTLR